MLLTYRRDGEKAEDCMKQVATFREDIISLVDSTTGSVKKEIEEFLNFLTGIYTSDEIDSHSEDIIELIMKYIELHD